MRILLIDDNQAATHPLSILLGRTGHEVTIACDGGEALRLARSSKPEVVLLDLVLPDIDGFDLAHCSMPFPQSAVSGSYRSAA